MIVLTWLLTISVETNRDSGAFVGYSATDIAALQSLWGVG